MTEDQVNTLWIGSFRYHVGRMTYAVGLFCELIKQEWENLPDLVKSIVKTELEEAFIRDDEARKEGRTYKPLGADIDRAEWEKVRHLWK